PQLLLYRLDRAVRLDILRYGFPCAGLRPLSVSWPREAGTPGTSAAGIAAMNLGELRAGHSSASAEGLQRSPRQAAGRRGQWTVGDGLADLRAVRTRGYPV